MASGGHGGGPPRKVAASEPRNQRTWKRSNSTAEGDDNASMNSNPLEARPNNWDFSDWQPSATFDGGKRRKKAKANPERERDKERERERERSLSQDSSPHATEKQHRTPSTFPRTKGNPAGQKLALENLRQHMTFSDLDDQISNDGERNNERKVPIRRDRPPNYTRQDTAGTNDSNTRRHAASGDRGASNNRNNNRDDQGPDSNHIVTRLMQIRDYIKQASSMMDTLQKLPDPSEAQKASKLAPVVASLKDQEHAYLDLLQRLWQAVAEVEKLRKLISHLREQEKSYMGLLQQLLALRDEASAAEHNPNDARNVGRSKPEILDETASVDLDVRSEASEATSERTQSSSSRPRIEDKLGVDSDAEGSQNSRDRRTAAVRHGLPIRDPSWDYEASRYESGDVGGRDQAANGSAADKTNELSMLREQQELLSKLVEQQEQLRALQGRQASLLAMQKEAEQRLEVAKARRNAAELASNVDGPQPPNIPADPQGAEGAASGALGEFSVESLPDLRALRHRLEDLKKNIFDVKSEAAAPGETIEVNRNADGSISSAGKKQLQDKLQELQSKKQRMDDLVNQLQELRGNTRVEQLLNVPDLAIAAPELDANSNTSSQAHINESVALSASASQAVPTDNVLELMETRSKLDKLQEVRGRLNQLRQLVDYYQQTGTGEEPQPCEPRDIEDQSSLPGYSDTDDLDMTVASNLRSPPGAVRARIQNPQVTTPATDSQQQSDDDNMLESDTTDTESHTSSLGPWGDDPEIQEKVRKLKAAKDKLRQLQDLVTTFQQNPDAAGSLPEDLANLANSLDEDMELAIPGSVAVATAEAAAGVAHLQDPNSSSAMSEGEVTQQEVDRREAEYAVKMQSQLKELDGLKDEREKLVAIRDQLRILHEQFPPQGEDEESARIPDRNNTEVKFAIEPHVQESSQTVTFASNDELYDRMRKQRILREELRQKKRELEAIMRKDRPKKQYSRNQDNQSDTVSYSTEAFGTSVVSADATMATWGGSTVENLESITEDEDASQGVQEDDAYPSDGIVQVEEEEEENEESGETYTIEEDVRQRRQARQQQQKQQQQQQRQRKSNTSGDRPKKSNRQTFPRPLREMQEPRQNSNRSRGYGQKRWSNNNQSRLRARQGNYRSPEDIIEEDEQRSQLSLLQQQLETQNSLCQSLLQDQQSLYQMFRTGYPPQPGLTWANNSFRPGMLQDPFALPPPLQQQHMMFNLNQCYQQMAIQQTEFQNLQRQFQSLTTQLSGSSPHSDTQGGLGDGGDSRLSSVTPGYAYSPFQTPFLTSTRQPNNFSLNPQFPASFAFLNNPNAYAAANGVEVSARLNNLNTSQDPARHGSGEARDSTQPSRSRTVPKEVSMNNSRPQPAGRAQQHPQAKKTNTPSTQKDSDLDLLLQQVELNAPASWSVVQDRNDAAAQTPRDSPDQSPRNVPRLDLDEIMRRRRERIMNARTDTTEEGNYLAQESAVIGRVYQSSARASAAANLASRQRPYLYRPGLSAGISGTAHIDSASVSSAISSITGSRPKLDTREDDTGNDLSLFETLRETIYSEVATLISQNENRPHFLIELFRELQLLTSDYLRQRALFSIQGLVSRYLTEENGECVSEPLPAWLAHTTTTTTNSELTPSESLLTSDDEDINVRLQRRLAATTALTQEILQRTGSLKNDEFDYAERAENTSSLSTPSTTNVESPFAQDSLGDTVIHLDQALRRMREYEQKQVECDHVEQVRKLTEKQTKQKQSTPQKKKAAGTSPLINASRNDSAVAAADPQSDSSTSDVPHPRINTQKIDQQIKTIMTEVIPVIKEHMDDICSPQLLAYIKRLVVSLTRQENTGEEFARFFNRQLGSILQDSLAKFEGRRLRECGEDLLLEMSEVLFNELAFCRLLQDLDDPAVSAIKPQIGPTDVGLAGSTLGTRHIVNYEPESSEEEGSDSSFREEGEKGEGETFDNQISLPSNEEEELGKMRDDELANEVQIQDADEKDCEPESQFKSEVIELAVSETKPFTRIGSDEDDEGSDESLSAEDPSETAVSRDAKMEDAEAHLPQIPGASTAPVLVNGDVVPEMNGELTIDDLPNKLTIISEPNGSPQTETSGQNDVGSRQGEEGEAVAVLTEEQTAKQTEIQARLTEEERTNSGATALFSSIDPPGQNELAGDGQAIKEPESSSC